MLAAARICLVSNFGAPLMVITAKNDRFTSGRLKLANKSRKSSNLFPIGRGR